MRATAIILALGVVLTTAAPVDNYGGYKGSLPQPDIYEAIREAESRLATALDRKAWDEMKFSMTDDIVYDNSQFLQQGRPGGVAKGIDQVVAATKAAFGDALVSHSVTTAKIELQSTTKARVITYLIYSHWDTTALKDDTKTFRIYEQCDDIWVLQDGLWKLQNSLVTNMGPNWEWPDVRIPGKKNY